MSKPDVVFDDAASYEWFMGGWSRAIGVPFLVFPDCAGAAWSRIERSIQLNGFTL